MKEWRMATNIQDKRTTNLAGDRPVVEPTSNGGVAVYDRPADGTTNPTLRPSASLVEDPAPIETRSGASMLTWIIGAIILIVLAYFVLQMIF